MAVDGRTVGLPELRRVCAFLRVSDAHGRAGQAAAGRQEPGGESAGTVPAMVRTNRHLRTFFSSSIILQQFMTSVSSSCLSSMCGVNNLWVLSISVTGL